ncbi:relaxase/mobilization nuclease domain-containing protein [Kitasatospora terrestris]|uniref:Relaxase/mobilization nuclease domain-containing protein n=1 Tax=Kitasatospora terrestris TaxID=258051 RepID=A0ABP9DCQ8_9ACTN
MLSDGQWAEVAAAMMDAAGIAPAGDWRGCRWVAVRHAVDHIHIVATKARQDGHWPNVRQDMVRMQRLARDFERRWGLRRLVSGDRTARKWPTTGESAKSERRGLAAAARDSLSLAVRSAAAGARDEEEFFGRLLDSGLRVRKRVEEGGAVTGYSVALPGDRDGVSRPVWFPGSKLAFDLSLPRVRERWAPSGCVAPVGDLAAVPDWGVIEQQVRLGAQHLSSAGPLEGAGDVVALGDLVAASATAVPVALTAYVQRSVAEFERASRAPGERGFDGAARPLFREAALALSAVPAAGRSDVAAVLGLLVALVDAVAAAERWHVGRGFSAQAESAVRAGRVLREAGEVGVGLVAGRAVGVGRGAGPMPAVGQGAAGGAAGLAAVVREAVPAVAESVLGDAAWPALSRRLAAVASAGHDPAGVLAAVASCRELGSADSVAEVLSWRLDGWLRQVAPVSTAGSAPAGISGTSVPPAPRPSRTSAARRNPDHGPDGPKRRR